jgi:hypothetical protein
MTGWGFAGDVIRSFLVVSAGNVVLPAPSHRLALD